MPHKKQNYIITYDIANTRRLAKVHRYIKKCAFFLQYSVYFIRMDTRRVEQLVADLSRLINEQEDDIRVYPVPKNPDVTLMGKQKADKGIFLLGLGGAEALFSQPGKTKTKEQTP